MEKIKFREKSNIELSKINDECSSIKLENNKVSIENSELKKSLKKQNNDKKSLVIIFY